MLEQQNLDLSTLPNPDIVEDIRYETVFEQMKQKLLEINPKYAQVLALESEPLNQVLQIFAYREMLLRQRINEAARANLLALAKGSDLEQLVAFYGVTRQQGESDDALRLRTKERILGTSTAGGLAHYRFQALSVSPDIRDISVDSPKGGEVRVSVLGKTGANLPELLNKVKQQVAREDVRVLTDTVSVVAAELISVDIDARIYLLPDTPGNLFDDIEQYLRNEIENARQLGWDFAPSWIISKLQRSGVKRVELVSPVANLNISANQCVIPGNIKVSLADREY